MDRIKIYEQDLTSISNDLVSNKDVVFIPGFAVPTYEDPADANTMQSGVAKPLVPVLCKTAQEFKYYFGDKAPKFSSVQYYPGSDPETTLEYKFSDEALVGLGDSQNPPVMFNANTEDPSYNYALELVKSGIPVLYMRINQSDSDTGVDTDVNVETMYKYLAGHEGQSERTVYSAESNPYVLDAGGQQTDIQVNFEEEIFLQSLLFNLASSFLIPNVAWPIELRYDEASENKWLYDIEGSEGSLDLQGLNNNGISLIIPDESSLTDQSTITINVTKVVISSTTTIDSIFDDTKSVLLNKNEYSLKYLTTGGYPNFEYGTTSNSIIDTKMMTLCASRGDCIAFIDHTNNKFRSLTGSGSVYDTIKQMYLGNDKASYATMITPWSNYRTSDGNYIQVPGSFAYLRTLVESIKYNPVWLSISGTSRGVVPSLVDLETNDLLTERIADSYQKDPTGESNISSINAICKINPYGYCIWGNRTLLTSSGTKATSYLNIRNMMCDIKKEIYVAAKTLMFEQNTDILWATFTSRVTPLLDQMQSSYGISSYQFLRQESTDPTKILATLIVYPIYAVESFEITIQLSDSETIVE